MWNRWLLWSLLLRLRSLNPKACLYGNFTMLNWCHLSLLILRHFGFHQGLVRPDLDWWQSMNFHFWNLPIRMVLNMCGPRFCLRMRILLGNCIWSCSIELRSSIGTDVDDSVMRRASNKLIACRLGADPLFAIRLAQVNSLWEKVCSSFDKLQLVKSLSPFLNRLLNLTSQQVVLVVHLLDACITFDMVSDILKLALKLTSASACIQKLMLLVPHKQSGVWLGAHVRWPTTYCRDHSLNICRTLGLASILPSWRHHVLEIGQFTLLLLLALIFLLTALAITLLVVDNLATRKLAM